MIRAGLLRERVTIQEQVISRDEYGAEIITWGDVATVWASVLPTTGQERFVAAAQQQLATMSHEVRIRKREGLTREMRLLWLGRELDIENIADPTGRRAELVLRCREVTP